MTHRFGCGGPRRIAVATSLHPDRVGLDVVALQQCEWNGKPRSDGELRAAGMTFARRLADWQHPEYFEFPIGELLNQRATDIP